MSKQQATIKFGTDGWRGIIADDFTVANVRLVVQALADWVNDTPDVKGTGVVVGYDRRAQSDLFAKAAAQVLAANDIPVRLSDRPCTSPSVSHAVVAGGCKCGVMITASHNPPAFNGFKIKANFGGSAPPELIQGVEAKLAQILAADISPKTEIRDSNAIQTADIMTPFLANVVSFVDLKLIAAGGFKVVVDPMHGSGAGYLTRILQEAGVDVVEIRSEHNPNFGGVSPEPITQNMQALFDAVVAQKADVGICLDGDADRIGACDSKGNFIDCHRIFAVILQHLIEGRKMTGAVVKTVSVTRVIDFLCEKYGLTLYETPIGFKYIAEKMMETDVLMGGEESGGLGVKGYLPERDGILMGLFILEAMAAKGKRFEDLIADIWAEAGPHAYTRNDMHPDKAKMPAIIATLKALEIGEISEFAGGKLAKIEKKDGTRLDFADGGWLLLRPSGTEPVVRVYAEAPSQERAEELVRAGVALVNGV
jgi:alpha-D-glucose phosphate-specific phosphoglucomutase